MPNNNEPQASNTRLPLSTLCPAMAEFNGSMLKALTRMPADSEQQKQAVADAKRKLHEIVGQWIDVEMEDL